MGYTPDNRVSPRFKEPAAGRLEQGAILQRVDFPEPQIRDGQLGAVMVHWPWAVVLTQECDLRLDRLARRGEPAREGGDPVSKDNRLHSVLLSPAFHLDEVLFGRYTEGAMEWRGTRKDILLRNGDDRFHYLPTEDPLMATPLILDFKLVVAAHPEYLEQWASDHQDGVLAHCPRYSGCCRPSCSAAA